MSYTDGAITELVIYSYAVGAIVVYILLALAIKTRRHF